MHVHQFPTIIDFYVIFITMRYRTTANDVLLDIDMKFVVDARFGVDA